MIACCFGLGRSDVGLTLAAPAVQILTLTERVFVAQFSHRSCVANDGYPKMRWSLPMFAM